MHEIEIEFPVPFSFSFKINFIWVEMPATKLECYRDYYNLILLFSYICMNINYVSYGYEIIYVSNSFTYRNN